MDRHKEKIIDLAQMVFTMQHWEWSFPNGYAIPSKSDIAKVLKDLEKSAKKGKSAETGGLRVEYDKDIGDFDYYILLNLGEY